MTRRRANRGSRGKAESGGRTPAARSQKSRATPANGDHNRTRIPKWLKFTIGAFVTAVIGAIVVDLYPGVKSDVLHKPAIDYSITIPRLPGWSVTVPDQRKLQPLLGSINSCSSLHSAAESAGGISDYQSNLSLLVQGATANGVTITDMHARIVKKHAPLNGAYIYCQSAGSESAAKINFNLNLTTSDAMAGPPYGTGQPSKSSLFANGSVVHLDNGETFPIDVNAFVSNSDVQWVIDATIVVDGHRSNITIDDHGRPFETTGALPFSKYGDLYEYDWAAEHRLLHMRNIARDPGDCSADLARKALDYRGIDTTRQILSVDCAGNAVHVEDWLPGSQCLTHHLGLHMGARWAFFATKTVCPANHFIGALFTAATVRHAGADPTVFANAFGPYIVTLAPNPANPGPYDHPAQPAVGDLARTADCTGTLSLNTVDGSIDANSAARCTDPGPILYLMTFKNAQARNNFVYATLDEASAARRIVGSSGLVAIGPTWLVYGTVSYDNSGNASVDGQSVQQFADKFGAENGQIAYASLPGVFGNKAPTISNGLL